MGSPQIVAVTGATGFLATELIKQLLAKGYLVRATVRSLRNTEKNAAVVALGRAFAGSVELFEADLFDSSSFDAAVEGATYVFHTASPVLMRAEDPQRDIVDPAVAGAESVLEAVARALPRPKRVVLTSSVAAVTGYVCPAPPKDGLAYTEADWNESSTLASEPYQVSKTLAERAAWRLAEAHGVDLVTILPSLIVGPSTSRNPSSSRDIVAGMLAGGPVAEPRRIVDIRDVARAHVVAAEDPAAAGRYIVSTEAAFDFNPLLAWFRELYPDAEFAEPAEPTEQPRLFDTSRARRELRLERAVPLKISFADAARTLLALGSVELKALRSA